MYFNSTFRKVASLTDISELKQKVNTLTTEQWEQHSKRQNIYKVHEKTQTIPLIFDADFRHRYPTVHPEFELFREHLIPAMDGIKNYYRNNMPALRKPRLNAIDKGYFVRILLVRLAAQSEISPHTDHGYSLSRAHRIHLPIETNEKVQFIIEDDLKLLHEGELWEINNRSTHSVKNLSTMSRTHFILDFVIPGEIIEEPDNVNLVA